MTGFHPLIEEQKAIALSEKSFDYGSGSSAEQKQGIGNKKGHVILLLDDGGKVVRVSIFKHGAPP